MGRQVKGKVRYWSLSLVPFPSGVQFQVLNSISSGSSCLHENLTALNCYIIYNRSVFTESLTVLKPTQLNIKLLTLH